MSCYKCTGVSARHSVRAHWCQTPLPTRSCQPQTPRNARRSSGEKGSGNFTPASETQTSASSEQQQPQRKSRLKGIIQKLTEMGPSGIAAYGILNSMYYTGVVAFMFVAVLKVQPGIGLQQGAKKLGEAFLSAWALSQLTKVPRALGAIALAPSTNAFMRWLIDYTWIENRRQGLIAIALACMAVVTIVMACLLATVM